MAQGARIYKQSEAQERRDQVKAEEEARKAKINAKGVKGLPARVDQTEERRSSAQANAREEFDKLFAK